MTLEPNPLIHGYLDETLSADELAALTCWLKATPENARQFAQAILLHDRLRGEHLARDVHDIERALLPVRSSPIDVPVSPTSAGRHARPATETSSTGLRRRFATAAVITTAALLFIAVVWRGIGDTPVSAAVVEVNRLIAANLSAPDRTYRIDVEEQAAISKRELPDDAPERSRPAKPPIDRAVLHVRSSGLFVLIRQTADGQPFVTGSNGKISWAVKPDGSVRSSADLTRFHRDVPGHEHSMPLININVGLEQLREAYEVQLRPIQNPDDPAAEPEPSRLIVAVRKPGNRGPQRVEVTYSVRNGLIRQMRFVEMPYGPERLTLRMTLVNEQPLAADFFNHESHHGSDRIVEEE